jgi:hypothetical protein
VHKSHFPASERIAHSRVETQFEPRTYHGDRGGGVAGDTRDRAIEMSASPEIDTTKVSLTKHFAHSKVRKSKPGLSGSMIRNDIVSSHF